LCGARSARLNVDRLRLHVHRLLLNVAARHIQADGEVRIDLVRALESAARHLVEVDPRGSGEPVQWLHAESADTLISHIMLPRFHF